MPDVLLLTDSRYVHPSPGNTYVEEIFSEDRLLAQALAGLGLTSGRVDWADPEVTWTASRGAVFRTTWDYFLRFGEFSQWLPRVATQTRLINPLELVRWNLDKHYLRDLDRSGLAIVPTTFIEVGEPPALAARMRERGWAEAVLKPAISGAGRHTYRIALENAGEHEPGAAQLLRTEPLMLQAFRPDILERGEVTLCLFDGAYSHAIRKQARPGEFRVQCDHGGTVHPYAPSPAEISFAERAFSRCAEPTAYGRVDLVRDEHGQSEIMELELIEPELWLREHPPAALAFATAIAKRVAP